MAGSGLLSSPGSAIISCHTGCAGGSGGEIFENDFSGMIVEETNGKLMYEYSMEAVKDFL